MTEDKKEPEEQDLEETVTEKKIVLKSATDSTIKPSDATRMAPAATGDVADPMKDRENNDAAASNPDGRRTIKLKPLKKSEAEGSEEETLSMDRESLMESEAPVDEDAATVKIEKPKKSAATVKPVIPGAKQTIKLRPSASTVSEPAAGDSGEKSGASTIKVKPADPAAAGSEAASGDNEKTAKKTIRLVPKGGGDSPKPSDPTTKLPEEETTSLPKPSAPTAKLPPESPDAKEDVEATIPEKSSSSKKTLKLRTTKLPAPTTGAGEDGVGSDTETGMDAAAPPQPVSVGQATGTSPDEGGVIFVIVSVVALIVVAYFTWVNVGQWAELEQDVSSTNVPFLSGTVQAPK